MIKYISILSFLLLAATISKGQEKILLWPEGAPMSKGDSDKDQPYLLTFVPKIKNSLRSAVIICPGGGYNHLADDHEGKQIAKWFNDRGVTAFILYYRLGLNTSGYQHPVPLMDADRAMKLVRSKAKSWEINPGNIGMMGFSAGGHLVSTLGTHFNEGDKTSTDSVGRVSSRPDFLILGYPVISLIEDYTHTGSRDALLGKNPDKQLLEDLSNERQVTSDTPPTFLVHTHEDSAVPPQNSIAFYLACKEAGVPAELHIYEKGKHGLGMINPEHPVFSTWAERLEDWLKLREVMN